MVGTPKTLRGAIENALDESAVIYNKDHISNLVRLHVKDFLSQKFSVYTIKAGMGEILSEKDVMELFQKCTQEAV